VRAVPRFCELYPCICLTTEGKARKKISVQNFTAFASWRPGFVHPCPKRMSFLEDRSIPFDNLVRFLETSRNYHTHTHTHTRANWSVHSHCLSYSLSFPLCSKFSQPCTVVVMSINLVSWLVVTKWNDTNSRHKDNRHPEAEAEEGGGIFSIHFFMSVCCFRQLDRLYRSWSRAARGVEFCVLNVALFTLRDWRESGVLEWTGLTQCWCLLGTFFMALMFNLLKTERRQLHLNPHSVPRCKHFSSRL
jgi:hypothetical protein